MGGSGGGPIRSDRTPEQVERNIKSAEKRALEAGFKTELANLLGELLSTYNERDRTLANSRIEELKDFIADDLESAITSLYGGSVAKHTYVDGLSDVDTLFVLKQDVIGADSPSDMLSRFADLVRTRVGSGIEVKVGRMAVTVSYPDGMELQILPAVDDNSGRLLVPSAEGKTWSKISPDRFQEALTRRNQECGGKLVPTVKLAKAINSTLPEPLQLTGYHIESIAVDAFRDYSGAKTTTDMLTTFYSKARDIVLEPIRDRTGQSVNVDDYLGEVGSKARQLRASVFERLEKRMRNASVATSIAAWKDIFGLVD